MKTTTPLPDIEVLTDAAQATPKDWSWRIACEYVLGVHGIDKGHPSHLDLRKLMLNEIARRIESGKLA